MSSTAGTKPKSTPRITLEVTSPYDGSHIDAVELADGQVVESALVGASNLFADRDRWVSKHDRIAILNRAAALVQQRNETLARTVSHESGKPLVDARIEAARAADTLRVCAQELSHAAGREIPMNLDRASTGRFAVTRAEPIGVVLAISAFNHPLNLIAHQVGPAIAAGCPVIIKPARDTPLSCFKLAEILEEAGLPEGWCQPLVTESAELAGKLAGDSRIAFFSFIGSARVGWHLRSKLAPGVRAALEHGGAAPVILADDADVDAALAAILKGGFYHAGQVCVSVQRVYACDELARRFAERLARDAEKLVVGDPLDPATDVGPLIRTAEVERVAAWVDEARAHGAKIVCGGRPVGHGGYLPTVLYDPADPTAVSSQEVFGPVVCIYPVLDLDEAIARANALSVAFQAAVFTRSLDTAFTLSRALKASAVMINDHTAFRVDWMPFAGLGQSGLGVGGIPYTFRDMQIEKMLVFNSPSLAD